MNRNVLCRFLAALAIAAAPGAHAQAPPTLVFEVATVKPVIFDADHPFSPKHFWAHISDDRASYWSMTPFALVTYAYGLQNFQVTGPDWAHADHFDIEGTYPEGASRKDQKKMLQALLQDRFKLAFHIEQRPLEAYVLVVGKHGAKLVPSLPLAESKSGERPATVPSTKNPDGSTTYDLGSKGTMTSSFDMELNNNHVSMSRMTLEELAGRLSYCLGDGGHKIIDETGIQGTYQIAYDCSLPRRQSSAGPDINGNPADPEGGSMLTRSLDALGLRLEKRKVPTDVYVIDHIEQPTAN